MEGKGGFILIAKLKLNAPYDGNTVAPNYILSISTQNLVLSDPKTTHRIARNKLHYPGQKLTHSAEEYQNAKHNIIRLETARMHAQNRNQKHPRRER